MNLFLANRFAILLLAGVLQVSVSVDAAESDAGASLVGLTVGGQKTPEKQKEISSAPELPELSAADESVDAPAPNATMQDRARRPLRRLRPERVSAPEEPTTPGMVVFYLFCYVFLLGGVLVLVLLALRKYMPGARQVFASPAVEVLGRTHLDPQRYISLVRVGKRVLVVGVTADTLSPLADITDEDEVAELMATATPATSAGVSVFQKLFERYARQQDDLGEEVAAENAASALQQDVSALRARARMLGAEDDVSEAGGEPL